MRLYRELCLAGLAFMGNYVLISKPITLLSGWILIAWNLLCKDMFLTAPTIKELQTLELSTLLDMLVEETVTYSKLIEGEGFSDKSIACKEAIIKLQAVIIAKQGLGQA